MRYLILLTSGFCFHFVALAQLTKVQASQCGTTLATPTTAIIADAVPGATHYRFEINGGVQLVTKTTRTLYMGNFSSAYNTTYAIKVASSTDGTTFSSFGVSCNVTTPVIPASKVQASQCGTTLATPSTAIIADAVSGATHYRFEISNGGNVQTVVKSTRTLYLGNFNYAFNTTYGVRVAASVDGTNFGAYGTSCNITSPPIPTTKIQASQCGTTLSSWSSPIIADEVSGATHYRFQVTRGATVQTIVTTRTLYLGNFDFIYSANYAIRVAASFDGTNFGAYGASCTVTTPVSPARVEDSQCGTALTHYRSPIISVPVSGATHYRFRITGGSSVQTVTKTTRTLYQNNFPSNYDTPYSIEVASSSDGTQFTPYGPPCTVSTSPAPRVQASQCGTTIGVHEPIIANTIPGAYAYHFELTNSQGLFTAIRKTDPVLYPTDVDYELNATYDIRVTYTLDDHWYAASGPSCSITFPGEYPGDGISGHTPEFSGGLIVDPSIETYPNPNNGDFTVSASHEGTFSIINELGQLIQTVSISKENSFEARVESMQAGVYFITGTINNEVIAKKVLVLK
jgi:hypothetical protein